MSTFEFDDKAHVERLSGTLHSPGATTGDVLTVNADKSISPAPGGGAVPFGVIRQTVLYSDFVDSVINPGSYRFAPIHDFVDGDALILLGIVTTEDFNDSNVGSLVLQATDDGNTKAYSPWGGGGVANPDTNGLSGVTLIASDDTSLWEPGQLTQTSWPALFTGPVSIGICDNGSLAGDGTAGAIAVRVLYIPAP